MRNAFLILFVLVSSTAFAAPFAPGDEFVAYLQKAHNPHDFGMKDGRFYPYSTRYGRRIGYRQVVPDKKLYAAGWAPADARRAFRADIEKSLVELRKHLQAKHGKSFDALSPKAQEILFDLWFSKDAGRPSERTIQTVLKEDWRTLIDQSLFVRAPDNWPDTLLNKAFAERWVYSGKLVPVEKAEATRPMYLAQMPALSLRNGAYTVTLQEDGAVQVRVGEIIRRFEPAFIILHSERKVTIGGQRLSQPQYVVRAFTREGGKKTTDLFAAADVAEMRATAGALDGDVIRWTFPAHERFEFSAELSLPDERGPRLSWRCTPRTDGFFSIGYAGAPAATLEQVESLWQPMIWNDLRLPEQSYLTTEMQCPIPTALVQSQGVTVGAAFDPADIPFRMPNGGNDLYGVAVRNRRGEAQPLLFAPVLGTASAQRPAGKAMEGRVRLIVHADTLDKTFEHIARDLCSFRDYRSNAVSNMNTALENMIDYAMGPFALFDADNRGYSYAADMPGAIKNVSPLHPLGLALVTDDGRLYRERALPLIEYGLSRDKLLFSPTGQKGSQSPAHTLGTPCLPTSELASLHGMFHGRSSVFAHYVGQLYGKDRVLNMTWVTPGGDWRQHLALYRATGDKAHLAEASRLADLYIAARLKTPQRDFSETKDGTFWDYLLPAWKDLAELYDETRNPNHLAAAIAGARQFARMTWFVPPVPQRDITVNKGGKAPVRGYGNKPALPVPEETVPAWRVSEIGLTDEGVGTSGSHRGIFLATHAPYFVRLAQLGRDEFLRDIGRSAMVGRYANFPGYHMNTEYTTVYEKPEFPLRPHKDFTNTSVHPNHIWPQTALLLDYLVADAFDRSGGQIHFPSRYVEAYAYLHGRVYGDRPGRFFDQSNVWLWMPKGLLKVGDVQLNYVAARGDGKLCVALMNQSDRQVDTTVTFNEQLTGISPRDVSVKVTPKGLATLVLDAPAIKPAFQADFLADLPPWRVDRAQTDAAGPARAFVLHGGRGLLSLYVYMTADAKTVKNATFHWSIDAQEGSAADSVFPYEATVPLPDSAAKVRVMIEWTDLAGTVHQAAPLALER